MTAVSRARAQARGFHTCFQSQKICNLLRLVFCRRCCWFILIQEDPCYSFAFSVDCRTGIEVDLMRSWGLLCLDLYLQNPVGVVRSAYACSWSGRAKPCQERSLGFLVPCSLASCLRLKSKKTNIRAQELPLCCLWHQLLYSLFLSPRCFAVTSVTSKVTVFASVMSSVSNIAFVCGGWFPTQDFRWI